MELLSHIFTNAMLFTILVKMTPILFAAIGGAFTQQGNILNIGLDGMMLVGAFAAISVGALTGSAWMGVLAGLIAGLLLALLFAWASLWLKADFIVVGIGVNLLAAGLTVFLLNSVYKTSGNLSPPGFPQLMRLNLGPLQNIPIIGPAMHGQTILVLLGLLLVPAAWWVMFRTKFGVHLRSVGEDEDAAHAAGLKVRRIKMNSVLISGALSGVGGAQLAMASLNSFGQDMTAGRGFIAVAALTFGMARPLGTFIATLIFGIAQGIADQLQFVGWSSSLALMVPYVITIIALVFAALRARERPGKKRKDGAADPPTHGPPIAPVTS